MRPAKISVRQFNRMTEFEPSDAPGLEYDKLRSCTSKKQFPTKAIASKVLGASTRLRVYECRWCNLFHIGSIHPRSK